MDKYKVVIVDDDDVALENLSFELQKDARFSLEGIARNDLDEYDFGEDEDADEEPAEIEIHSEDGQEDET